MSLQSKIDRQLSEAGKNVPQIVINNESGSVNLPVNVSATFRNCSITSLTTAGNSRVNVEGGTVQSMDLTGTAIIVRNCPISGTVTATDSKLEFDAVTCSGAVTLTSTAFVSKKSTYSQPFTASAKSVIRSVVDTFSGSSLLTAQDSGTAAVFINATITTSTLLTLTAGAKAEIDGGTVQSTDMGTADASTVEIRNCTSFQVTSLLTASTGSKVILRKMTLVQATSGFTLSSNTYLEILDVQTVQTSTTMFTMDNSRLELVRFITLTSGTDYLQATNNSAIRIANGTTMRPGTALGKLTDTKVLIDKIATVITDKLFDATRSAVNFTDVTTLVGRQDNAFILVNSALTLTGCTTVGGKADAFVNLSDISSLIVKDCNRFQSDSGRLIIGSGQGEVHISGCANIFSDSSIIDTSGVFTVTISGCGILVASNNEAIKMSSNGGSTLNVAATQQIHANQDTAIKVTGVDTFLTALPDVGNGSGSRYTIYGLDGGTGKQQIVMSKVIVTNGGISLGQYHADIKFTTFPKFHLFNCDAIFIRCTQQGSQALDDADIVQSTAQIKFGSWDTAIYVNESILECQRSTHGAEIKPIDSILRLECIDSTSGVISQSGGARGSFIEARGFDITTVTSSDSKKDTFFLANVGTPTYSGRGSLLVMESGEPDEGEMDYIMIKDNNLRIFDYRNCYMDVTNDHHRYSPDNIQDDADNNIYITAQINLDLDGVQQALLESTAEVVIQAPVINEQS